ncbi:MAG TPA: hypothetical protein VK689_02690 [Armatimonadota bacterium]|nr:hypothetical protein [Armatimonadota bacterium]
MMNRHLSRHPVKGLHALLSGITLAAALLLPDVRASAAPPVLPMRRISATSGLDAAARRLGFAEWGSAAQNDGAIHVALRVDGLSAVLMVGLPPTVPQASAHQWLQQTSGALGWPNAILHAAVHPDRRWLRITSIDVAHRTGYGRRRMSVDLALVRRRLRRITRLPVLMAVRASSAEITSVTPQPAARGQVGGSEYLFYRLDQRSGATSLAVEYGLTRRWMAAAGAALVGWILFAFLAAFAVGKHARADASRNAKEKLALYRRRMRGVLLAALIGPVVTLVLLSIPVLFYVFGDKLWYVPLGACVWPVFWAFLGGHLATVALEREISELQRDRPWYQLLAAELYAILMSPLLLCILVWAHTWKGPGWMRAPMSGSQIALLFGLLLGLPLLIGLGAMVWEQFRWRRRRNGVPAGEQEAPEPIRSCVRELTARVGWPIERVLLARFASMQGRTTATLVSGNVAVVSPVLADRLQPIQVAGLVAAHAGSQARGRADTLIPIGLGVSLLMPVLAIGWMIATVTPDNSTFTSRSALFLVQLVI